jgi:hypothetical protein
MWLCLLSGVVLTLVACQAPTTAIEATSTPNRGLNLTATVAAVRPSEPTAATTPPPIGSSRVDTLNAANNAFTKGDLTAASGLYERVLNTPPTGEPATTTAAINDFAYFRDIVTLLADGREDDAHTQLMALQQADANAPMTRLGSQLWDQYGMVGQLRGACAQLQPQVATQAGATLGELQTLGVSVDPATLCVVPSS